MEAPIRVRFASEERNDCGLMPYGSKSAHPRAQPAQSRHPLKELLNWLGASRPSYMVDVVELGIHVTIVVFTFGAALFAYSMSRQVGRFRAWTLMIVGFLFLTERSFVVVLKELGVDITFGSDVLAFFDQDLFPLLVALIFLVAMFDLHRLFPKKAA